MAQLAPVIRQRFFNVNGEPLSGGRLYTYLAGTSTLIATYADESGTTPNSNPVILNAAGEANVWLLDGAYKFILRDADDVDQWSVDDVNIGAGGGGGGGGGGVSPWIIHPVADGQSATPLVGETMNAASISSQVYEAEIARGTTVRANGRVAMQNINGTIRVVTGGFMSQEAHGVTFSVSQVGTVGTLRAALSSGPGAGTIKLQRISVPASA